MRVARTIRDLDLPKGQSIGLVPTMGAFHDGHLSLMRASSQENDFTVVSLFVNPTQFGEGEDFESYPRDEERDFALAAGAGADLIFAPPTEAVYPRRTTVVQVKQVTELWEGEYRPGHFEGVATVVCKLFNMVQATRAYFGLKDFQQCAVIRRMVEDLNMSIQLSFRETVREPDGLAMSSRNVYLSQEQRDRAARLYETLINTALALPGKPEAETAGILAHAVGTLTRAGFLVDYFALVDSETLKPLSKGVSGARLIAAARIGKTRLIDNVPT